MSADLREPGNIDIKESNLKEEVVRLWPYLRVKVEAVVNQAIEDAKRGYR